MALLVVTGPPGAGKSIVARIVAPHFDPSVLVDGDAFFGFVECGFIEPWLAGSHEQNDVVVHAAAAAGRFTAGATRPCTTACSARGSFPRSWQRAALRACITRC
jgi:hypothetical protein